QRQGYEGGVGLEQVLQRAVKTAGNDVRPTLLIARAEEIFRAEVVCGEGLRYDLRQKEDNAPDKYPDLGRRGCGFHSNPSHGIKRTSRITIPQRGKASSALLRIF